MPSIKSEAVEGESYARELDKADELAGSGSALSPPGTVYMDGNSLGLLSRDAEESLLRVLTEWKELGIDGWTQAAPPWFYLSEELSAKLAALVGAEPEEVIITGSTTSNLHNLMAGFYRPTRQRFKIVADELNFPSDKYALESQLRLLGLDPDQGLVLVNSRDNRT